MTAIQRVKDGKSVERLRGSGRVAIVLFAALLLCTLPLGAQKGKKGSLDPRHPLATAENQNPPATNAGDLAYRVIRFEQFAVPKAYVADASEDAQSTRSEAMTRLIKTGAFVRVEGAESAKGSEPFLLVKGALLDHKIVSTAGRVFGGALAGSSRIAYWIRVYDGAGGTLIDELDLTTENSAFSAAWSYGGTDRDLPYYLGRFLGDYLALRARQDRGVDVMPLWGGTAVADSGVFTDPATQLTWSSKDNRATVDWAEASQYAREFHAGGFSDWRLPTEAELTSLYNESKTTVVHGENAHCVDQVRLSSYLMWTGEERGDNAKVFDFRKGKASFKKKNEYTSMRVLLVRK